MCKGGLKETLSEKKGKNNMHWKIFVKYVTTNEIFSSIIPYSCHLSQTQLLY